MDTETSVANIEEAGQVAGKSDVDTTKRKRNRSPSTPKTGPGQGQGKGQATEEKYSNLSDGLEQGTPDAVPVPVPIEKATRKKSVKNVSKALALKELTDNVTAVLLMGCAVASKFNKVWEISKQEAEAIAEPLCKILEKKGSFEKMAEASDSVALVVAVGMVFVPRAVTVYTDNQQKKARSKTGLEVVRTDGPKPKQQRKEAATNSGNGATPKTNEAASNGGDSIKGFLAELEDCLM